MRYFDSHAHYYDERFESQYESGVDNLIDALLKDSVSGIINIGTNPESSRVALDMAKRHEGMYAAVGIHPTDAQSISQSLDETLSEIEKMIKSDKKVVCLGEIGLDYHYDDTDRELQMRYFDAQLTLARELDIPVSIHDRDAHGDIMDMLRRHKGVRGVLHSYSGSPEMARELVKLGYMISFSGTVTFTNARRVREVAESLSSECCMIETDCPYLAPHPHRGSLNHSGMLSYTNASLASCLKISPEECASVTDKNAREFFGIL